MAALHLLSLPNEIISHIIDTVGMYDTWSLAQTSSAFYHLSRGALRKHGRYKDKYSTIRLGSSYRKDDGSMFEAIHPLVFLQQIVREPSIADYVSDLRLSRCRGVPDESDLEGDGLEREHAVIARIEAELAVLVAKCPWYVDWEALIRLDNQPHHLALLLTLLPNLRSMSMRGCGIMLPITEMIWDIAEANCDYSSPRCGKALSRLTKISVDHWDTEYGQHFRNFESFLALPSMRSLYGHMIYGQGIWDSAEHPVVLHRPFDAIRKSEINEIKILYSAVDSKCFAGMIRPIQNLKSFTYEHGGAIIGDAVYECSGIMAILRDSCRHSLEHLDLTCDMGYNEEEQFVGSLKDFHLLRTVRLNAVAFCDDDQSGPTRRDDGGLVIRMAEFLPASIQTLTLVGWLSDNGPVEILGGLADEGHALPELKQIFLEGKWDVPKDQLDTFESVNIELVQTELACQY
ncbi:MAG: hypothetical protein Q9174_002816 [Haloplaca sp. 1 TL-2023]